MTEPCLRVRDVSKWFGELAAVDGVSFEVASGEHFGIAGPNGAGKTTLFNMITGIPFHPDAGTVEFNGVRIDRMAPYTIYRRGIARTFQTERAFDSLTVRENVWLAASFGHGDRSKRLLEKAVADTLAEVGLACKADVPAGSLRVYERKLLMLASAVVVEPALLMLDEPAGGLSPIEIERLMSLIRGISGRGTAVVIIEHVLPVLFGLSDRVMVMDMGKKLAEGLPEDVAKNEAVVEAYLGERGREAISASQR